MIYDDGWAVGGFIIRVFSWKHVFCLALLLGFLVGNMSFAWFYY